MANNTIKQDYKTAKKLYKMNEDIETLDFKEKSIYGRVLIYPNCKKSNILSKLLGGKTFTSLQLSLIESLGYRIHLITIN